VLNIGEYRLRTNPWDGDTDRDGWSDTEEIAGDMDPLDPDNPGLAVNSLARIPALVLRWKGGLDVVYQVEANTNLVEGAGWNLLPGSTFTAGVSGTLGFTNAMPDGYAIRFFRPVRLP
jgi:hypothetical protein